MIALWIHVQIHPGAPKSAHRGILHGVALKTELPHAEETTKLRPPSWAALGPPDHSTKGPRQLEKTAAGKSAPNSWNSTRKVYPGCKKNGAGRVLPL